MGNTGASFVIALLVKNASKNSGLPKTSVLVDYEIVDGLQICHWPVSPRDVALGSQTGRNHPAQQDAQETDTFAVDAIVAMLASCA
jgi:hypothetical protein